jgi:hypothetical protein
MNYLPLDTNITRIAFPGFKSKFDRNLLLEIIEEFQTSFSDVVIKWVKYVEPSSIWKIPTDYMPSNSQDANMLIVEKNGKKILEVVKYRSLGSFFVYDRNLDENEIVIISRIFQRNGVSTVEYIKRQNKFVFGDLSILLLAFFILHIFTYFLLVFVTEVVGWKTGLIIVLSIYIVFLIIFIWRYWKFKSNKKKK